jgi:hypothetical protein
MGQSASSAANAPESPVPPHGAGTMVNEKASQSQHKSEGLQKAR